MNVLIIALIAIMIGLLVGVCLWIDILHRDLVRIADQLEKTKGR